MAPSAGRKIVFLDIDGTLSDVDGYIPPSTFSACHQARRNGHLLYICSGRPRAIIGKAVLVIGFDGLISSAGAHIETGLLGEEEGFRGDTVFDTAMPASLARRIAGYFAERGGGFSFEKNDALFSDRNFLVHWERFMERFTGEAVKERMLDERAAVISRSLFPDPPPPECYEGVNKILFVGGGSVSFEEARRAFAGECEVFHGSFAFAGSEGGEIGPAGIHKGWALKEVARLHGIAIADTIAFGDSDNDRPMLESAGTGIAMGNAEENLKAIAAAVTAPLRDDGIFKGFERYGLI